MVYLISKLTYMLGWEAMFEVAQLTEASIIASQKSMARGEADGEMLPDVAKLVRVNKCM